MKPLRNFLQNFPRLFKMPLAREVEKTRCEYEKKIDELSSELGQAISSKNAADAQNVESSSEIEKLSAEIESLKVVSEESKADADSLRVELRQLYDVAHREGGTAPLPPKHLQFRVVGVYAPDFIESGYRICRNLDEILAQSGKRLADFGRVLDFGCGCGRVSRALRSLHPQAEIYGSDIDEEAIGWLQEHCSSIADFRVNPHRPKTNYPDDFFDFVFSISVLTHLPEDMQFEWLQELKRITKPDGCLVLSTHGENHFQYLSPENRDILESNGFVYQVTPAPPEGLPDYYHNTFHKQSYIKKEWSRFFEIVTISDQLIDSSQDAVLILNRV